MKKTKKTSAIGKGKESSKDKEEFKQTLTMALNASKLLQNQNSKLPITLISKSLQE